MLIVRIGRSSNASSARPTADGNSPNLPAWTRHLNFASVDVKLPLSEIYNGFTFRENPGR